MPLLDRDLIFNIVPNCLSCGNFHTEMQRLKVIQILVDKVRASRIRELTITDKNLLCVCRSAAPIPDQMWSEFRNLCFAMICSLIRNAHSMIHLRSAQAPLLGGDKAN